MQEWLYDPSGRGHLPFDQGSEGLWIVGRFPLLHFEQRVTKRTMSSTEASRRLAGFFTCAYRLHAELENDWIAGELAAMAADRETPTGRFDESADSTLVLS